MKKHINIVILIVVAVLALAIVAVAYWQLVQENKSFDWKKFGFISQPKPIVYEELKPTMDTSDWLYFDGSKEYGITFKYPKDWEVTKQLASLSIGPKNCSNLSIKDYEGVKGWSTVFDFIGYNDENSINNLWFVSEKKGIIIDGQNGIKIKGIDKEDKINKEFISIEKPYNTNKMSILNIETTGYCSGIVDEIKILENIILTIKFYR